MSVLNAKAIAEAEIEGRVRTYEFVKNVNQVTAQGIWYDLTGASGNPRAKQWFDAAPLVAQQIKQSTDGGIFHGGGVSALGMRKYLRMVRAACASATPLPMQLMLCDYLLYYPSIEDGNTDPQAMDNTLTLPRYASGLGVQMMAITISSRTGGQAFNVSYTNSDGVAGRLTPNVVQNTAAAPGSVTTSSLTTQTGGHPFIPLQDNDRGVQSVQSVQMLGADTGFFAIVLVRPLLWTQIRGIDAPYDKDPLIFAGELEEVQDDAYLSLLALPKGSLSGAAVRGNAKVIWN